MNPLFGSPTPADIVLRLIFAAVLGSIIGFERQISHRPAGLRTHTMVSVGSALFTLLSIHIAKIPGSDATRIAAQIVSGIGFLGAGTIIQNRIGIQGLTTAASLWATAALGMAAGSAYYTGAVCATVLLVISLTLLRKIDALIHPEGMKLLAITCDGSEKAEQLTKTLSTRKILTRESGAVRRDERWQISLEARVPPSVDTGWLTETLREAGATNYEWQELS